MRPKKSESLTEHDYVRETILKGHSILYGHHKSGWFRGLKSAAIASETKSMWRFTYSKSQVLNSLESYVRKLKRC